MTEPRLKGMGMINVRSWFDQRLGEGWFIRTAREFDPEFPERLLPGEWYPVRVCVHVYKRGFEQLGGYDSQHQLMEIVSREVALNDLNGIMRAFLWATTPKMFLRATPKIWASYTDFATVEVATNETGRFTVRVSDISEDLISWVTSAWAGFLIPALKLAGGKDPQVTISEVKQTPRTNTWEFSYELTYT
jgi:hypothetical protein